MSCTCAGTAPGYPQHEPWCGRPETDTAHYDQPEPPEEDDEPARRP